MFGNQQMNLILALFIHKCCLGISPPGLMTAAKINLKKGKEMRFGSCSAVIVIFLQTYLAILFTQV
jgi:hypothetical protein